jgi:hypothetical protein
VPNDADNVRVVIDETSFDFHGLDPSQLDMFLDQFNEVLYDLRRDSLAVWKPPLLAYMRCLDEYDLYTYVTATVDREIMRRFFSLIDKCPEWDAGYPRCEEVALGGRPLRSAWSASYAVTAVMSGRGVACLAFSGSQHRGFCTANSSLGQCQLFFFSATGELVDFWRALYALEDIAEQDFFRSADRAFPGLLFHPDLNFRRFQGSYRERRDQVVQHLGALNDHFLEEHGTAVAAGRVSDIESYFGSRGIGGVSRESVKTHSNPAAMHLREVEFNGDKIICEWHTKLRPEIDRIHFAFGGSFGDKVLIGIFVDHLPT